MMKYEPINLHDKLSLIAHHWQPKIIAQMNDYQFKLAKIRGEFIWHSHSDTDEVFIVLEGNMEITLRDGKVSLSTGEMFIVPKGTEHKPVAQAECWLMLVEPAGTVNTGDAGGDRTVNEEIWI